MAMDSQMLLLFIQCEKGSHFYLFTYLYSLLKHEKKGQNPIREQRRNFKSSYLASWSSPSTLQSTTLPLSLATCCKSLLVSFCLVGFKIFEEISLSSLLRSLIYLELNLDFTHSQLVVSILGPDLFYPSLRVLHVKFGVLCIIFVVFLQKLA